MREIIILACGECKRKNYTMTKNRRLHPGRVEYKKFCPFCRKHITHKQTK